MPAKQRPEHSKGGPNLGGRRTGAGWILCGQSAVRSFREFGTREQPVAPRFRHFKFLYRLSRAVGPLAGGPGCRGATGGSRQDIGALLRSSMGFPMVAAGTPRR